MPEETEKTGAKQPKEGQFPKGKSGNPKGRPKGARNKTTLAAEALMDGDAEAITSTAIELAKAGDTVALRLCMERILPTRKNRPLSVDLPAIEKPEDILKSVNAVLSAVATGKITTDEADALLRTVEAARKAMETEEMHRQLDEMQARLELLSA